MFEKNENSQDGRTYVAKTDQGNAVSGLTEFAKAQLVQGAGGYGIVTLENDTYLVITFREERKDVTHTKTIKKGCLERHVEVEVQPLTRLLQRRLGWGDVGATEKQVEEAVKQENATKLKILLPRFKHVIDQEKYQLLPKLMKPPGPMIKVIDCDILLNSSLMENVVDVKGL